MLHAPQKIKPPAIALALIIGALVPPHARAQRTEQQLPEIKVQAQPETAIGLDQGYVAPRSTTGTQTDTPLIETPQSISVITRERMDDQKVQTVDDAPRYAAGVMPQFFGFDHRIDAVKVRGFDLRANGGFLLYGMRLPAINFRTPNAARRPKIMRSHQDPQSQPPASHATTSKESEA